MLLLQHNTIQQLGCLVAKQKLKKHSLGQQPVFRHRLGVDLKSRFQVLVPQDLLHRLDIDFHLHQHRGKRSSEGVKTEGTRWRDDPSAKMLFWEKVGDERFSGSSGRTDRSANAEERFESWSSFLPRLQER